MICHILDLSRGNHCSKWKYFQLNLHSYDSLCSNSTWKKKSALRIPWYFWEHFQDLFVVPYHRLFFKVIQNLFYPHPNQPNNQPRKLQLKITPISMLFSTHVLQNVHLGKHLHCTHTSTCRCSVNTQFWLLFFNHYLEFECPLQLAKCFNASTEMQTCISDTLHWPKAAQNLCFQDTHLPSKKVWREKPCSHLKK